MNKSILAAVLLGLSSSSSACPEPLVPNDNRLSERQGRVSYYDRNGDGVVDLEKHHYPGLADADWQLVDDDYDGRYEKKILRGIRLIESDVDLPVPTHVRIEAEP